MANNPYQFTQTGAEIQALLNKVQSPDSSPTANSTNLVTSGGVKAALDQKADKVSSPTAGNFAGLDSGGNLTDSGKKASDFATAAQGGKADTAYQKPGTGIPKTDLADGVQTSLGKADTAVQPARVEAIEDVIPSQASSSNQLADKAFVNSSVATGTATFRGTYNLVTDLGLTITATAEQIAATIATKLAALSITPDNNDYVFVQIPTANDKPTEIARVDRYKYNGSAWGYEYSLNNSGFTAAQWATLNSGLVSGDKTKLDALPTNDQLTELLNGKESTSNKTTTVNAQSTDSQYPSAKAVNTAIGNASSAIGEQITFLNKSLGKYSQVSEVTLSQNKSGKYVNVDGGETSASGYGISNSINLNFGDILLVPSAEAVPAVVSVVARIVTRTYAKVITYTYTYQQEDPTLYNTATADYDQSLVYTAVYDTSGETPVLTGWIRGGTTYETLPATREVSESYYEPLVKQAVSAMPSTGYYVYLCPQAMTVVISGLTSTVSGGVCQIVGLGIFKNIVSNFLSMPGQNAVAQALCDLEVKVKGILARLKNLGDVKAISVDSENLPRVCGQPLVVDGAGAPSVVPHFVGQRYHDTTNKKCYEAFAVTGATSDWTLLN